jgi:DNA-binding response OmpR family regulator
VHTGAHALEAYQDADMVLLDLKLTDLDGLEVCRTILTACDVPVIVRTARESELDCVLAFQAGADGYVVTPRLPPARGPNGGRAAPGPT